jgi:DNA-binding GntR family transcriptional regulator
MAVPHGEMQARILTPRNVTDLLRDCSLDSNETMAGQIFEILKDLIVSFQVLPRQLISEKEIAEALKASKTPVREAMIRLENANLVNIVSKSGTYVAPLNIQRYKEACFTRLTLEAGCVRIAAENPRRKAYKGQFQELLAAQRAAHNAEDFEKFFHLDGAFHALLFDVAQLPGVWKTIQRTQLDVYRVRHLRRLQEVRNGLGVVKDHAAIVAAILAGDPDAAEAALRSHIGALNVKIRALAEQPGLLDLIETLNVTQRVKPRPRRAKTELVMPAQRVEEGPCRA